jgi:hypothetical protein
MSNSKQIGGNATKDREVNAVSGGAERERERKERSKRLIYPLDCDLSITVVRLADVEKKKEMEREKRRKIPDEISRWVVNFSRLETISFAATLFPPLSFLHFSVVLLLYYFFRSPRNTSLFSLSLTF